MSTEWISFCKFCIMKKKMLLNFPLGAIIVAQKVKLVKGHAGIQYGAWLESWLLHFYCSCLLTSPPRQQELAWMPGFLHPRHTARGAWLLARPSTGCCCNLGVKKGKILLSLSLPLILSSLFLCNPVSQITNLYKKYPKSLPFKCSTCKSHISETS